jgi:YD repeat-containing protein
MFSKILQRRIAWLLVIIMVFNQIGTPALAVSQNIIRPGAGVSRMPLEVTNFSAPGFGEVSDAVNLANGNAYVAVEGLSRNNQLTASDETKDSIGTTTTPSTGGQWQLTSRLRLGGFFKGMTTAAAPASFNLYSGDGSAQTFAKLTAPPVWTNTPTWIQRYQNSTNAIFYNSSVQTGTQYAQTWIVLLIRTTSHTIAHYYDGSGSRVSFYKDGEYADYAQNPYQQYWGAKYNADTEGEFTTPWTASPAAGTPKTEIVYDLFGYGWITEVKDQWGRRTTYQWNTTDGTLLQISHLIQPDGTPARFTTFVYVTVGGQRVLSAVQYMTYDGRGTGSGSYILRLNKFFYVQQASTRVVLKAVQRPIVGSQGRITTVYTYDSTDRVTGVNTVDIGNTDYTATASTATNVEPAITYTYGTTNNVYGGKTVTVSQYENGNVNTYKETQYLMNISNQLIMKRVRDFSSWLQANPWYGAPSSRWLEWTYSYTANGSTKTITQPSGRVEQYTYDVESAVSASNPTQAGNVVKQATFTSPTALTNNTPERSQTFTYNIDNQRTQSLTPALTGTRDGVNYSYSKVQTDTSFGYYIATVGAQTFKPIAGITNDTKNADSGTLTTKFSNITNIDELGRMSSQQRTSPSLPTKTTTYSYFAGTTYKPYMTDANGGVIQSTRDAQQYGDLVWNINDGLHSTNYIYDWYGNVNLENRVAALSSDQKTNGTPTGNEYRKDRVNMTGYNGFGQKTFESIYEYDRQAAFKQWFWYATGELDSSWEAYNTNTTDYTYNITGVNAGRVAGIVKGEGPGNGGVTTPHETTTLTYDAFGRVNSTTTDGFVTTLSYDTLDRVVLTILPQPYAAQNSMAYSLSGTPNFECSADPSNIYANHCQYKAVDSLGRVTALTHATNGAGQYTINTTFDPYDRPIRVNDTSLEMIVAGEGRSSYIAYDSMGNVVKALSPIMRNAAMPTTGMQNYGAHTDSRRPYTEMTYDSLGRKTLERKILHDTVDLTAFNSMVNARSTLTTIATSEAKTSFEYDTWDRVKKTVDPDGYATSIAYDGMDNVTSQARDLCGGVADCATHMQGGISTANTSMTYDAKGRLTSTTDPNGVGKKVQYTDYGPVQSETDSITASNPNGVTRKFYTYTADGLPAAIYEPDNDPGTTANASSFPTGFIPTKSLWVHHPKISTERLRIWD